MHRHNLTIGKIAVKRLRLGSVKRNRVGNIFFLLKPTLPQPLDRFTLFLHQHLYCVVVVYILIFDFEILGLFINTKTLLLPCQWLLRPPAPDWHNLFWLATDSTYAIEMWDKTTISLSWITEFYLLLEWLKSHLLTWGNEINKPSVHKQHIKFDGKQKCFHDEEPSCQLT